jgi:hypothetical protein
MLREAGVQAIFGPGTNLVDAAGEVLKLLGHNFPTRLMRLQSEFSTHPDRFERSQF